MTSCSLYLTLANRNLELEYDVLWVVESIKEISKAAFRKESVLMSVTISKLFSYIPKSFVKCESLIGKNYLQPQMIILSQQLLQHEPLHDRLTYGNSPRPPLPTFLQDLLADAAAAHAAAAAPSLHAACVS